MNIDQTNNKIVLKYWLYVDKTKQSKVKYCFNNELNRENVNLITIAYVGQDVLLMLGKMILQDKKEQSNIQILAYASQPFVIGNQYLQIVYIPTQSSSSYSTSKQALTHILKYHSQKILTPCHHNHLKSKIPISKPSQHYILINSNEIYQVNYIDNRMQLIKRIQAISSNHYSLIDTFATTKTSNSLNLRQISNLMDIYLLEYDIMMNNNDKNWVNYTMLVLMHSYIIDMLQNTSDYYRIIKNKQKYLSPKEIKLLEGELEVLNPYQDQSGQYDLFKMVCLKIMKGLIHQNQLNFNSFLQDLKDNFDKLVIGCQAELHQQILNLKQIFHNYQISQLYLPYITQTQQQTLFNLQKQQIQSQNQNLKQNIEQLNTNLSQKQQIISQYHNQIDELQHFKESMDAIKITLKQICDKYQSKQRQYHILKQQLEDAKISLENNKIMRESLQNKCNFFNNQKRQLLISIKEMNSQNLNLMNQIEALKGQIKILQDKLEQSQHIEARALSSIQNEAEIKVRLNRYENYVNELKQCMHTFKKLQIQKFNYILSHNSKQFNLLNQRHQRCKEQLLHKDTKIRQLQQKIECQRIRIDYFQKMYISNYYNDTIYQVSQENSATDREVNAS